MSPLYSGSPCPHYSDSLCLHCALTPHVLTSLTLTLSQAQCQELRKRKELELQILTEAIRLWEGDDIRTLGSMLYMSQALVHSPGAEVSPPVRVPCPAVRVSDSNTVADENN